MDGSSTKKSTSLETLVIQNIADVENLKAKLNDIIKSGKDYEYDVSSCLKTLLSNNDQDILQLTVKAISELVKCDRKRQIYAKKDIIDPIICLLRKELTADRVELIKQCCRALGNLCCDCDDARKVVLECNGIKTLISLLANVIQECNLDEIKILISKTLLNFAIGGQEFSEELVQGGVIHYVYKILLSELEKDDMNDDVVSSVLQILSIIDENVPEFLFDNNVNAAVLCVLKETTNVEISELCLDHFHDQAEHDSVKTLLANEDGIQLVCKRLEQLVNRHDAGDLNADETEIEAVIKQACDLIIIVLTGDEAMHILYKNGFGDTYVNMVKWLDSTNYHLLTTGILAIGNFARQDDYCTHMMENKIFDKLLDLFETYHGFAVKMQKEPDEVHPIDRETVTKIQHAILSALRNLTVPVANKRVAARGRATQILLHALPNVDDHHVAYKLLAAIRMLVDGQESVARQVSESPEALRAVARWSAGGGSGGGGGGGAAGEAPRLLAWSVRQLRGCPHLVRVEGCILSLVNMLIAPHSLMQNEAILALTLLAIEAFDKTQPDPEYEKNFTTQLIKSEIGKHISVLIETNCAKMPVEVAENLIAFLDITSNQKYIAIDYKETKVQEALHKFTDSRKDLSEDMKTCISAVLNAITENGKE